MNQPPQMPRATRLGAMQRPAYAGGGRSAPAQRAAPARDGDTIFKFYGDMHLGDNDYEKTIRRLTTDLRQALRNAKKDEDD